RFEGVAALLASRGIELPWGDPDDPPESETLCGLGNRKNAVFGRVLEDEGITPYPGSLALLDRLAAQGVGLGVSSTSRNVRAVMAASGLSTLMSAVVESHAAAAEIFAGKSEPVTEPSVAELPGVEATRAVVASGAVPAAAGGGRVGLALVA